MPILIDAGPSRRGWSYWGPFFQCPRLFAYQRKLGIQLIGTRPTTRGTMGHLLQAHQHAAWGARQPGGCWVGTAEGTVHLDDPVAILPPEAALDRWLDLQADAGVDIVEEDVSRMLACFRAWLERHPEPPGEVAWVEVEVIAMVGYRGTTREFGLWVVDDALPEGGTSPSGDRVEPHLVNGLPVEITRRIDLVYRRGAAWVACDHKHTSVFEPGRARDAYAMDGGMASQRILCAQVFEPFRGLDLQVIHTQPPYKSAMVTPAPTPHRDAQFAWQLLRAAEAIRRLEEEGLDPWYWPVTQSEVSACYGRYGACKAMELCSFGPAAIAESSPGG